MMCVLPLAIRGDWVVARVHEDGKVDFLHRDWIGGAYFDGLHNADAHTEAKAIETCALLEKNHADLNTERTPQAEIVIFRMQAALQRYFNEIDYICKNPITTSDDIRRMEL